MSRRKFLALVGGGVVLAAGAVFGTVAVRTPTRALEPWSRAGSAYNEPRKKALSYALLAPNPHNRQPWLVDLSKPDSVSLFVDMEKLLPNTDPLNRQITIGLGCFLEVMSMAAAQDGYSVDFALFPEGENPQGLDKRPVAVATFTKDDTVKPDPLFAHVPYRQSLKEPYDLTKPVPSDAISKLTTAVAHGTVVSGSNVDESVMTLRKLTYDALLLEIETPHTYQESVDLFRIGKNEVEANPDGIDFSGPLFETLHFVGAMTREASLDRESSVYAQGKQAVLQNTETAMAHIWQVSATNTRVDQLNAGRDWVRVHLAATAEGLALQPLSQALQEYPEMRSIYDRTQKMLAPDGGTVQMLARLGYAERVAPSPRWPLEAKIVKE